MTINYTTLVADKSTSGSIKNWVNYDLIPSVDMLTEAEAWIYSTLRVREMEEVGSISISLAASTVTLPTGFRDPIAIKLNSDSEALTLVDRVRFDDEVAIYDSTGALPTGHPSYFTISGTNYQFDTVMDEAKSGTQRYYKTPDALSGSNETNFLTTKYPALLRYVCSMIGYEHRKQWDEASRFEQRAANAIAIANAESDLALRGAYLG